MSRERIYLDYNGSTPLHDTVRAAMLPFLSRDQGNPSSAHWAGAPAREAVEHARCRVAHLLGCRPDEIVFTSGGTEANNAVLVGTYYAAVLAGRRGGRARPHFVTTAVEHPAITEPLRFLERLGAEVTFVGVDGRGVVDPDAIGRAIKQATLLISVMHANNEVGTIQSLPEISRIAHDAGVRFHSDAAQSVGKIPTKVDEMGVDLLSIAGHKFYGPKGAGALYVRDGVALEPFLHGAGHERGRRAGTENVLLDVGLGAAAELAEDLGWIHEVGRLSDRLWNGLLSFCGDRVVLNGHPTSRLPNTLNVSFPGYRGADILAEMPEIAATTGSACHTGAVSLSPVLAAMGVAPEVGAGAIRFSLGRMTTAAEVDGVLERVHEIVHR